MKNKVAVISGGLGDIGSAIALGLAQQGVRVALGDLYNEVEAEAKLEELERQGCGQLFYKKVDVTSQEEVLKWLEDVEIKLGLPQIIVPNAGIVVSGGPTDEKLDISQVQLQMDVNFWGSYFLAVNAAKRLKDQELPGRITFIGSWAAERPNVRVSSYCISKAAVRMLCKTLALDLVGSGINVNEVAPGIVEGGLSKKNQQKDPELLHTHLKSIPVHRLISVSEIAKHVVHLSDFKTMNITGSTLLVDGGLSLTSKMTP